MIQFRRRAGGRKTSQSAATDSRYDSHPTSAGPLALNLAGTCKINVKAPQCTRRGASSPRAGHHRSPESHVLPTSAPLTSLAWAPTLHVRRIIDKGQSLNFLAKSLDALRLPAKANFYLLAMSCGRDKRLNRSCCGSYLLILPLRCDCVNLLRTMRRVLGTCPGRQFARGWRWSPTP
jgi:hypothetical protein